MAYICSLASGSSGNALVFSCGSTHILLDAGISCLRIKRALGELGLSVPELSGILITHPHSDHISGLATLSRQFDVEVYATFAAAGELARQIPTLAPQLRCFDAGDAFCVGEALVQSFPTSHDAPGSVGYRIDAEGCSFGALTDSGIIPPDAAVLLGGVDTLLLESNHDVSMVQNGPYPYALKQRILGPLGHLSNETAAAFAAEVVARGTRQVILAHLSRDNNTPARAEAVNRAALNGQGELHLAPRETLMRLELREGATVLCRK